ncbi:MAG: hypothetical protein LBB13_03550 [Rickettsiales bacterium]|jgi:hypothetical protein|nr:hypothetical protein [Rickettsiales bacterium]
MKLQSQLIKKHAIVYHNFIAKGPLINYDNIAISGPNKDAFILLNGGNNYKLLMFGKNAKNISLRNLHLNNGNNENEYNIINGGGAIHLSEGVVVNLENLTFSDNQTTYPGGANHLIAGSLNLASSRAMVRWKNF